MQDEDRTSDEERETAPGPATPSGGSSGRSTSSGGAGGQRRGPLRRILTWTGIGMAGLAVLAVAVLSIRFWVRHHDTSDRIAIEPTEYTTAEYEEQPTGISPMYRRYQDRTVVVERKDGTVYDVVLKPGDDETARVELENVDLAHFVPRVPEWAKGHAGNEKIALIDREWNRQQVRFPADSSHVVVEGGDGYAKEHLASVHLARNCLNGGLWEIKLYEDRGSGGEETYYHGWFTFPLGHYWELFEELNPGKSYWSWFYSLEHWVDPTGTQMDLEALRTVTSSHEPEVTFRADQRIFAHSGQERKLRTVNAPGVRTFGDFFDGEYSGDHEVTFATFRPPGVYDHEYVWTSEYWRFDEFEGAVIRETDPAGPVDHAHELELRYTGRRDGQTHRILVSGIDLTEIPQLPRESYAKGFKRAMGIGVGPFYQGYEELSENPPYEQPYFSVLVDDDDVWIDHHTAAVDGPVMHRDREDPNLLHVYLLSYERHTLIAHYEVRLDELDGAGGDA